MEFGMFLRLVGVMNLILIWSCLFNIQGREPYLYDLVKKQQQQQQTFSIGLYFRHLPSNFFQTWFDDRDH